ncbi:N-acetyltransferase 9 [Pontoporia blainvillei]|uniref:N-acetyltransferase 9 n=1 Tax=Pontoporia blainvillei TaxID=48723 RepID=A0ABX0S8I4_PONBL|nr:N-acetyltransferase 9 [Pontoporia blainvillei]
MKSEELRRLTASEPLTLEQEYVMQHSWQEDADSEKWRPRAVLVMGGLIPEALLGSHPLLFPAVKAPLEPQKVCKKHFVKSLGECTFIVLDAEKWQTQPGISEESCMAGDVNLFLTDLGDPALGEIEVMIAGLTKFEAKIGRGNEPSIRMFRKLHFEQVAVSSVFQEVTLRLTMSEPERRWLLEQTSHVEEKPYRAAGASEPR